MSALHGGIHKSGKVVPCLGFAVVVSQRTEMKGSGNTRPTCVLVKGEWVDANVLT